MQTWRRKPRTRSRGFSTFNRMRLLPFLVLATLLTIDSTSQDSTIVLRFRSLWDGER